jgi:hypothetical protein
MRLALAVAVALIACSSYSSSGSGTRGTDVSTSTIGDVCNSLNTTLTDGFESCLKATPAYVATLSTNHRVITGCQQAAEAVAKGRATYDAAIGAACVAAIQALAGSGCAALSASLEALAACQNVVAGTVASGGSCFNAVDCISGSCDTSKACPGTCNAYLTANQACGIGVAQICAPSLTCDPVTSTCKTPSPVNGPCPCREGTYCNSSTQTCAPLPTSGACAPGDECAPGFRCVSATCQAIQGVGGTCAPSATASTVCTPFGTSCDPTTNQCAAWRIVGSNCTISTGGRGARPGICPPPNVCVFGQCVPPLASGATCNLAMGAPCKSGFYCDSVSNPSTCKAQLADGAPCSAADPFACQSSTCTNGACAPRTAGVACLEP